MKVALDFIRLRKLRRVDYMRERNILGEVHVQSYVTLSVLLLGGFGGGRQSTLFSLRNSIESLTPFIRKYSFVL